ncbi:hypothetical protein B5X24_HaOG202059 [Helicoverpa armigera]|uniref:Uncharacterized protein n=1 Tax=Helicoverpa armigera TaxID=29058 RepID=A0A2W1BA59_HELAM|nr:hypothetical protein B5X24_HaOG202059 [Helicoverpa armigera]
MSKLIVLVVLVAVLGSVMCQIVNNNDHHDDHHVDHPTLLLQSQLLRMRPLLLARGAFSGDYCVPPKVRVDNICVEVETLLVELRSSRSGLTMSAEGRTVVIEKKF